MRVFVAIDIDNLQIIEKVMAIRRNLMATNAMMKFVETENLHITLKFLGEVDPKDLEDIKATIRLCAENVRPFTVHLVGIGCFPSIRAPRVIWIGTREGTNNIEDIANCIDSTLYRFGFKREGRKYHSHLTIARVKRYNLALKKVLQDLSEMEIGWQEIHSVKIKKSTLTPKGPIYEDIFVLELK